MGFFCRYIGCLFGFFWQFSPQAFVSTPEWFTLLTFALAVLVYHLCGNGMQDYVLLSIHVNEEVIYFFNYLQRL